MTGQRTLARELRILADLLDRHGDDADEINAIAGRVEGVARDLRAKVRRLDRGRAAYEQATGRAWCRNTLGGRMVGPGEP